MTDPSGTNQELLEEISVLKQKIKELEHSESERKHAEAALQKSEEKYRTLIEKANEAIIIAQDEGKYMSYDTVRTAEYYDQVAGSYDELSYSEEGKNYPANLYRLILSQNILSEIPRGRILDAGCGTGKFLAYAVAQGYDCVGCDFSQGMLEQANINLRKVTDKEIPLLQTSLNDLSMFEDDSFDHVFCLGVLPYIPENQEGKCYEEMRRIIKSGGYFITAHENELFDIFTFNKYTLRFFERNIYPVLAEINKDADLESMKDKLATLITNPDKPVNTDPKKSGRDIIFTKPENPLTYHEKLTKYGFTNKDILYYNFHALPPLLRNNDPELIAMSRKLEIEHARIWQGMFIASTFISVAQA